MSSEDFEQVQQVRGKERSNLDILHQCATHYSEHMGQIFYIAKQCLAVQYKATSIYKQVPLAGVSSDQGDFLFYG